MADMRHSRFGVFTQEERDAIHDGLLNEADLNPEEDDTFPPRIAIAKALLAELEDAS